MSFHDSPRALIAVAMMAACGASKAPTPAPHAPVATPATAPSSPAPCGGKPCDAAIAVSAGAYHACALRVDGTVRCWGSNTYGQLGDGTRESRSTAVEVRGLTDAVSLATGDEFTCAVRAIGTVACWGRNWYGELGAASPRAALVPQPVPFADDAVAITAGHVHACALRKTGAVACWGGNVHHQAAPDVETPRVPVVAIKNISDATAVVAGSEFTCVKRAAGLTCWGAIAAVPKDLTDATSLAASRSVACARVTGGGIDCWQTAGTYTLSEPPQLPGAALAIIDDDSYTRTLCAIDAAANVMCAKGAKDKPVQLAGIDGAIALDGGTKFACAVDRRGDAYCWGDNKLFQLGDGTVAPRTNAVRVQGIR